MKGSTVPRHLLDLLSQLMEHGLGRARLDIHGRLVAGPTKQVLAGSAVDWLAAAAWCLIWGCEDKPGEIEITPLGLEELETYRKKMGAPA
jgi:hypothetical protein